MKALVLALLTLALDACLGREFIGGHGTTNMCCELDPWALDHINEVNQIANRLRNAYSSNSMGRVAYGSSSRWTPEIIDLTGKTASELNALVTRLLNQIRSEGRIDAAARQPNYFEWRAAQILEQIIQSGIQQEQFSVPKVVRSSGSTQKNTVVNWAERNMEPSVVDYLPIVNVAPWKQKIYQPPVHIPVDGPLPDNQNAIHLNTNGKETITHHFRPGSTVTIRHYNRTTYTDGNGTKTTGTEVKQKWVNGKLVHSQVQPLDNNRNTQQIEIDHKWTDGQLIVNREHPFVENTPLLKEEAWKREERDRLFWLLARRITPQQLEAWERQQEERLVGLAERYHLTLDDIQNWHNAEYQRFEALKKQYRNNADSDVYSLNWKQIEQPRLDWLIHQNSLTRDGLEQWQRENIFELKKLATQYRVPLLEFKNWQLTELDRLHKIFHSQNQDMLQRPSETSQQRDLNNLIREHNDTIDKLHISIANERERLANLSLQHQGNVQKLEVWLQNELNIIHNLIKEQNDKMSNITSWQQMERDRLADIVQHHKGSVKELEEQMLCDHEYLKSLAAKYNVTMTELEEWQHNEMQRFVNEGRQKMDTEIAVLQNMQKQRLKSLLSELTVDEFRQQILSDRSRLEDLARSFRVERADLEKWLMKQIEDFKSGGLFKEVKEELELWKQQERDRLTSIATNNELTVKEFEDRILKDRQYLYSVAQANNVRVDEIEKWLKGEIKRLKDLCILESEQLKEWQKESRVEFEKILQSNYLTVDEFRNRLATIYEHLQHLVATYDLEASEFYAWSEKEIERLTNEGYFKEKEKLESRQQVENLLRRIGHDTNLSQSELLAKLKTDQHYFILSAIQYNFDVNQMRMWLERLQNGGNFKEKEKLENRPQVENLLKRIADDNNWSLSELLAKLNTDQHYLVRLGNQYNFDTNNMKMWLGRLQNEGNFKEKEKLENRTQAENLLQRIADDNNWSLSELFAKLNTDHDYLDLLGNQYNFDVTEMIIWLQSLNRVGYFEEKEKLGNRPQVENLLKRIANDKNWSLAELFTKLTDEDYLFLLGKQYNFYTNQMRMWLERLQNEGYFKEKEKLENRPQVENLLKRIADDYNWSLVELFTKLNTDQDYLVLLGNQYNFDVNQMRMWLGRLQNEGYFKEKEKLEKRPQVENLLKRIADDNNWSLSELFAKLNTDQHYLVRLGNQYNFDTNQMRMWLRLLQNEGYFKEKEKLENRPQAENLLKRIADDNNWSLAELFTKLNTDQDYLVLLGNQYNFDVNQMRMWLGRLQNEGYFKEKEKLENRPQVENLLKRIADDNNWSLAELFTKLNTDQDYLVLLGNQYNFDVNQMRMWLGRLQNEGYFKEKEKLEKRPQVENLLKRIADDNNWSLSELFAKLNTDQHYLVRLGNQYNFDTNQMRMWLRLLQNEGYFKEKEKLENRPQAENLLKRIADDNNWSLAELFTKLNTDQDYLVLLGNQYNFDVNQMRMWLGRLQNEGYFKEKEKLENRPQVENLLKRIADDNNWSLSELLAKLNTDQHYLVGLGNQYNFDTNQMRMWVEKLIEEERRKSTRKPETTIQHKPWQQIWLDNFMNMLKERPYTADELYKWVDDDCDQIHALAVQNNENMKMVEQWINTQIETVINTGVMKPPQQLARWQKTEQEYLDRIAAEKFYSMKQLEDRLRKDRERLEKIAADYKLQVDEVEKWMQVQLERLIDEGQVKISNLTAWQFAAQRHLDEMLHNAKQWTVEEFEQELYRDRQRLESVAFRYHVAIGEIEEWLKNEVNRRIKDKELKLKQHAAWQEAERMRILKLLEQQSNISAEEFEAQLRRDYNYIKQLANQYHVEVNEVNNYVKEVIEELRAKGMFEVENLKAWQIVERDYITEIIGQYRDQLSIDELEDKLRRDRAHLHQLADQYRISVEEIEAWMIKEFNRLLKNSEEELRGFAEWQKSEMQRVKDFIRENQNLNYLEFEARIIDDRARLADLANRYSLSVEVIENFLRQMLLKLKTSPQNIAEKLTQWQEDTQKILISLLLRKQRVLSVDELAIELRQIHPQIQQIAQEHGISVTQIDYWIREEYQRLSSSGLFDMKQMSWQQQEQRLLEDWLRKYNYRPTIQEFNEYVTSNMAHLVLLAQPYQISANELEAWLQQEAARLRLLGYITVVSPENTLPDWKKQTRDDLMPAQVSTMTQQQFEEYLMREHVRLLHFAQMYNVSVEEIENWLRQVALVIIDQRPINVEEWKSKEQLHIESLIEEKLRKQQQWSIEELLRWVINDEFTKQLAFEYNLSLEEIAEWLRATLQQFLDEGRIISEHLVDWQRREKDRIFLIVRHNPKMTMKQLEELLLHNPNLIQMLSIEYGVQVEELEFWIRGEIKRLADLGLVDMEMKGRKEWQRKEADRLRNIAAEISITEDEFLRFIENDDEFQRQLVTMYRVPMETLAPFQRIELAALQREGLLENPHLFGQASVMVNWQIAARDQLLQLIRDIPDLETGSGWQRKIKDHEFSITHNIDEQELLAFQIKEMKRLRDLAKAEHMSLQQLGDFYANEKSYISFIMHKMMSSEHHRISWGVREAQRVAELQTRTGLTGEHLLAWRRRLYLLCQGRLVQDNTRGDQPSVGDGYAYLINPNEPSIADNDYGWQHHLIIDRGHADGSHANSRSSHSESYYQQQHQMQRVEHFIVPTATA